LGLRGCACSGDPDCRLKLPSLQRILVCGIQIAGPDAKDAGYISEFERVATFARHISLGLG
jgi:hypothetical protein